MAVEQVPFEDVPALVPRAGLVDDEGRPIGGDDLRPIDLMGDERPRGLEPHLVEPPLRDALAAPHRRANLRSLLDQEGSRPAHRRVTRRRAPRGPGADDEDVELLGHRRVEATRGT